MTFTGASPDTRPHVVTAALGAPAVTAGAAAAGSLLAVRGRVDAMAHLGIWRMELGTGRLAGSAETFRILGLDPATTPEPEPGSIDTAVHPDDRGRYADAIGVAIAGGRGSAACRIERPDGTSAWVRIAAERELDASGTEVALVGYVQELDATDGALGVAVASGLAPAIVPDAPSSLRPVLARKPAATARLSAGAVLLVEDDDLVRSVLGRMLGHLGFCVLEASTADEALELIGYDNDDGFDLVVTDIRMPGVSGPELARRIRAVREVPVLFVSGYSADLADEVRNAPSTGILEKPFDAESLGAAIRTLLTSAS